jgi:hypothetical protein
MPVPPRPVPVPVQQPMPVLGRLPVLAGLL